MISPSPKNNENYNKTRTYIHTGRRRRFNNLYYIHSYMFVCVCVRVHVPPTYILCLVFFLIYQVDLRQGHPYNSIILYSIWRDRARIAYSENDNRWSLTGSSTWGTTLGLLYACINNSIHYAVCAACFWKFDFAG